MKHATPIAALLLASVLAGCLQANPVGCPEPIPAGHAQRFDGQTLTILDQGAFYSFDATKEAFKNRTGATVELIEGGDAGKALQSALLGAGNPPADILYGVDNALFFTREIRDQCLFIPYESGLLSRIDTGIIDVDQFRVEGDLWVTPADHGYVSINYDKRLADDNGTVPVTLQDLASPQWASQLAIPNPQTSSPGLLFLLATIDTFGEGGDYPWQSYWTDLLESGALIAKDWTDAYEYHFTAGYGQYNETTHIGDRTLVVSYTTSPAVEVYFGATEVPSVSLEPARGVMHQIETMGILRGTKNPELAAAYIDFVLSAEWQDQVAPYLAVYPVTKGTEIPDVFHELATEPADLEPAQLRSADIGPNLDRWLDEWVRIYQQHRA